VLLDSVAVTNVVSGEVTKTLLVSKVVAVDVITVVSDEATETLLVANAVAVDAKAVVVSDEAIEVLLVSKVVSVDVKAVVAIVVDSETEARAEEANVAEACASSLF